MKKTLLAVSCVAAMGLVASNANAQCDFNTPAKAKGFKSDVVRFFTQCIGSSTFAGPNTLTMAGVPACTPPYAPSAYQFGEKGACSVKSTHKLQNPCEQAGSSGACSNITLQAKCKGIIDLDGTNVINGPPASGNPWKVRTLVRATFDDQTNGDLTVFNFEAFFEFGEPKKGGLKMKSDTNALLTDLFGPGSALPGCTALHILDVNVVDPQGNKFGGIGTANRG